jgi:origin recognition complex subunit 1
LAQTKNSVAWSVSPSKGSRKRIWTADDSSDSDEMEDYELEKLYTHLAIDSLRGLYYEFSWSSLRSRALAFTPSTDEEWGCGKAWEVELDVESPGPSKRGTRGQQRKADATGSESEGDGTDDEYENNSQDEGDREMEEDGVSDEPVNEDESDEYSGPKTPSKKRKRTTSSPSKARKRAYPTPHSRARLGRPSKRNTSPSKRSPLKIRPPPPIPLSHRRLELEALPRDPWLRAMHVLHVGSRPDELPCREEEYSKCLRSIEDLVGEGESGCVCKFCIGPCAMLLRMVLIQGYRYCWSSRNRENCNGICHRP